MMKTMKKLLCLVLCLAAICTVCFSCAEKTDDGEKVTMKIGALNGPTGMGLSKMLADKPEDMEITLFGAADEVKSKLITGELDAALIPANLAAVINNKTDGKYLISNINTLGVLYVVERGDSVKTIADLNGKTVYSTGQASTPEYILNYLLNKNNVKPADIVYKTEHAELLSLLLAGSADVAVLPQPFVTTALSKSDELRVALDLTEEWRKTGDGEIVQGVTVVSKEFAEKNPELLSKFASLQKESVDFTNNNVEEAAKIIAENGILPSAEVAKKAIPACHIVYIDGEEMNTALDAFYPILFGADPSSLGGVLPNDGIFYTGPAVNK